MANRPAVTLCAVAVTVSVLSCNPTSTSIAPSPNPLCTTSVGGGSELHGNVIEPCELPASQSIKTMPTTSVSESPPAPPRLDPTDAINSLFVHRMLMHNTLISMTP